MTNTPLIFAFFALLASTCTADIDTYIGPSRVLQISDLDHYVNTDEGKAILESEFQSIEGGKRKPWTVAEKPENIKKNRYEDLLPYDETRVVLEVLPDDPDSDYINANYIDGHHGEREYVATQGPLPNTINDLWRLVWQVNATKIIMLANILEHGKVKVEKYWPETVETYGDIIVTKISQYEMPKIEHVVRTFSLRKEGVVTPRTVRHFHFTGWPDLGVPQNTLSIIAILEQARKYRPDSRAPMIIHCSAGIGRTGTVILTDSMIQKAKDEGSVDFPKRLDHMRLQRVDVVEKKEQYVFAHKAIYDLFNGNETDDYLQNVDNEYNKIDREFSSEVLDDFPEIVDKMKWHNNGLQKLIQALERSSERRDNVGPLGL